MSHHVFVPVTPRGTRVAYALLVGLTAIGVAAGWVFTTGRMVANSVSAAQQDFGAMAQTAQQVHDQVVPEKAAATVEPTPAPATQPKVDPKPVLDELKAKLEAQPAKTE